MTDQSILKKLCLMLVCLAAFSYTGLADTISTINGTTYDTARPVNADALRFSNPDGMDTNFVSTDTTGSFSIINKSLNQSFVDLVLQVTFQDAPSGVDGTINGVTFDDSEFSFTKGRIQGGNNNAALTNVYNQGYILYIDLMTPLASGATQSFSYSFDTLPALSIFNVYGVSEVNIGRHRQPQYVIRVSDTNPNSNTFGVDCEGSHPCGGGGGGNPVPEPTSLTLLGSGLLGVASFLRRKLFSSEKL